MRRLLLCALLSGCALFQKVGPTLTDTTVCVLQHSTETPEQIAIDCSGVALADIIKIISAHKAAERREAQRDAGAE